MTIKTYILGYQKNKIVQFYYFTNNFITSNENILYENIFILVKKKKFNNFF